ncbi:MAG: cupin domain-containing protein [Betaproteobacteria bacterium]|nr:cupin domain-containing protein [Betaproteobacteria bacterium]
MKQAMSDTGLADYELMSVRLDLVPGGVDATPHRHDADLFVYVLEGSIEVELDGRKATYAAGAMFHEPRNALHSLLRNTSADQPASALAVLILKNGREFFVPAVQ